MNQKSRINREKKGKEKEKSCADAIIIIFRCWNRSINLRAKMKESFDRNRVGNVRNIGAICSLFQV